MATKRSSFLIYVQKSVRNWVFNVEKIMDIIFSMNGICIASLLVEQRKLKKKTKTKKIGVLPAMTGSNADSNKTC